MVQTHRLSLQPDHVRWSSNPAIPVRMSILHFNFSTVAWVIKYNLVETKLFLSCGGRYPFYLNFLFWRSRDPFMTAKCPRRTSAWSVEADNQGW